MRIQRVAVALLSANLVLLVGVLLQGRSAIAQSPSSILCARAIELVDDRGQVRAQLDVEPSGEVVFRLRDASGTIRVKLGASDEGSGLLLLGESTEPGVRLLAKQAGTSVTVKRGSQQQVMRPWRDRVTRPGGVEMAGVLTVLAKIYPKAGREAEVEALLVKMAAAVREHEPDCLVYRPHRSTGEPTVFYFYEQYRTDAAFEFHRTAPHLAGYRSEMRELVARPTEVELYRALTA